jgi:phage/plasmid-like protein (TIGR03299 family)
MVETMAYSEAGGVPWHNLGKKVPADLSPDQMLEAAGLDWEVEKRDLWFFDTNSEDSVTHAPGKQVLVRTSDNQILDFVGDDWNPLQNRDAFEFFTDFVNAGDMSMDTAGSLEDGRRVWALAKVNDAFEVFKDDVVENYLLFSNPHKYGMSIDVRMTPIRVVLLSTSMHRVWSRSITVQCLTPTRSRRPLALQKRS